MDQATLVQNVVQEVMRQLNGKAPSGGAATGASAGGKFGVFGEVDSAVKAATVAQRQLASGGMAMRDVGVFGDVDSAVKAATVAQRQLASGGMAMRDGIVKLIKQIVVENKNEWARIEFDETKVGRIDHKVAKLELLPGIPGVEFLRTAAHSGDDGISLDEAAPWGVLGVITPVTHSIPTLTANAISMIASGNAMVVNAHPSGANCARVAVETYNRAIAEKFGVDNLITIIDPPSLRSAEEIFRHPDIPLLVATGGPAVARAAAPRWRGPR